MKANRITLSPGRWVLPGALFVLFGLVHAADPVARDPMDRALIEPGVVLEYEIQGQGEQVVLVHAGLFADWFRPLLKEPILTARYRVLSFHRVGYAGSTRVKGPVDIARQAAHLRELMRHLGIDRAHIVGHSSGANIALQLALDAPHLVRSLALLEPALPLGVDSQRLLSTRKAAIGSIMEHFRSGNRAAAIDGFMRMVSGPDYRPPLEQALPGAFDAGVADADTFFGQELPAIQTWQFTPEHASHITQPVLAVVGERSPAVSPIWAERQQLLLAWLPNVEGFVLPGTTHLLHVQNPRGMADALVSFFSHHAIEVDP